MSNISGPFDRVAADFVQSFNNMFSYESETSSNKDTSVIQRTKTVPVSSVRIKLTACRRTERDIFGTKL